MSPRRAGAAADRGSATVWVLAVAVVLAAAGVVVSLVLGVVLAHRRALSAADLSALAAAERLSGTPWRACEAASVVARANGAALVACDVQGDTVVVTVAVHRVPPLVPPARGTARAGAPPGPTPVRP